MADNQPDSNAGASSAGTQNTDSPRMIPYDRFQEVNERAKRAEAELDRLRAQTDEAQRKALEKQGEYKTLWETAVAELQAEKQFRERAEVLGSTVDATNKKRIERIPEGMRSVIPTDYTPDKLSAWLDANEALLTKQPAPNTDAGRTGDNVRQQAITLGPLEAELAKLAGMTPEQYATFQAMAGKPPEIGKPLDK